MPFPFVSRERYDEKCAELRELRAQYEMLIAERVARQPEPASKPAREPKPPREPRDPMLDKLTADLSSTITDPAKARAEAQRIKLEAFGGSL